jgi:hypothetical protein
VLEEGVLERGVESVNGVTKGGSRRRKCIAGTTANVNRRDVKKTCLPTVAGVDEGGVRRVSLERGDGGEDSGGFEELLIGWEVQKGNNLSFRDRAPHLLVVEVDDEVLVWVDGRRDRYASRR